MTFESHSPDIFVSRDSTHGGAFFKPLHYTYTLLGRTLSTTDKQQQATRMEWPDFDYGEMDFFTERTEIQVWNRALRAALADSDGLDSSMKTRIKALVQRLEGCSSSDEDHDASNGLWKKEYRSIVEEFIDIQASVPNEQSLDMAQAGLDTLHDRMLFRIDEQTIVSAKDVFVITNSFPKLDTATALGCRAPDIDFQFGLSNPVQPINDDTMLYGMEAVAQIDAWFNYGIMETSASVLAKQTFSHGAKLPSTLANKRFVLLGCTAELGPAKSLLLIPGVTVLGVARGGTKLDNLLDFVRSHSPDDTTFVYNPKGANILTQGPQIAQWILDQTDDSQELVIIPLAQQQQDGEANVRLAIAMDLIVQRVLRQRRKNATLCYYMSPTTPMMVPPTATSKAAQRLKLRPTWEQMVTKMTSKWMQPSWKADEKNHQYSLVNGTMTIQGPLHVLAKTIQVWRSMIAYYRDEHVVAAPYAPLCRSQSNISLLGRTLDGMHHFEPMLAMDVEPASTLMAAILVSQIQFENRPMPDMDENPFTLFWDGSVQ